MAVRGSVVSPVRMPALRMERGLGAGAKRTFDACLAAAGLAGSLPLWGLIALAIKYTMGWRLDAEAEAEGIDYTQHGETGYDLVGSGARLLGSGGGITTAKPAVPEGANA